MWVRLGRVGAVGAAILLVGLVLVGAGFAISALAAQSEFNCTVNSISNNCQQTDDNAENTSIGAEFVVSGGLVAAGVGAFLVVFAMISLMARRDEALRATPPPLAGGGSMSSPVAYAPTPLPPPPSAPPGPGGSSP